MEMPLGKGQVARFWTAKEKNQTEDKLGSRKLDKLRNRVEKKKKAPDLISLSMPGPARPFSASHLLC